MGYEVLIGESCYTASEAQKLSERINAKGASKIHRIGGRWLYYVQFENGLDKVKEMVQATSLESKQPSGNSSNSVDIYITPRNTPSPWSSKATSIAEVCGVKARIERGRVVTIELSDSFDGDLSFKDIIHDRMTESFTQIIPEPVAMFAEGARGSLEVVDIFADARGPLATLQDYNRQMGLGLDLPNMEYLVEKYKSLGRSPVRSPFLFLIPHGSIAEPNECRMILSCSCSPK
jgi:phosphoribosylformylglycinamidine synthase